jgi:hypothetical protein
MEKPLHGTKPVMVSWKKGWLSPLALVLAAGFMGGVHTAGAAGISLVRQTDGPTMEVDLPLRESEIRFKKELAYAGSRIVRSQIFLSPDRKAFIGFACDLEEARLYLDMNRNLDLTDDPEGVFVGDPSDWRKHFQDIVIPVEQGGRRRELLVDISIMGERWGHVVVKSSWGSDEVAIGDGLYRVAVVDNGDGVVDASDRI